MLMHVLSYMLIFGRPFAKRFSPMLSDRCPAVVCILSSVCNVGALWPKGWMNQDEIGMEVGLEAGHIVLDGDPAPSPKGHSRQLSAHVRFVAKRLDDQDATWYGLYMEVGLVPSDIVRWGPSPPRWPPPPKN